MKVVLDHTEDIASNIKSFWFKPEQPIRYDAGQFIELFIPHDNPDDRGIKHWFTLSSSPTDTPLVSITTKFAAERSSTFKQALRMLQPGDELTMSDPMGDFVLPKDPTRPLLFIAAGIGVTPFHSIIKSLVDSKQQRDISIIYGARVQSEFAFQPLFEQSELPIQYVVSQPDDDWHGLTGTLTTEYIKTLVPDFAQRMIYMSGPEPLVEKLVEDFKKDGIPEHHLVGDYFPNYPSV